MYCRVTHPEYAPKPVTAAIRKATTGSTHVSEGAAGGSRHNHRPRHEGRRGDPAMRRTCAHELHRDDAYGVPSRRNRTPVRK